MDDAKQQLIDKLKSANNLLVTVSRNPSVDQLAACLGLTLLLNKQGKHAAAVFSGTVPSTLEFLQPEETLEKNTDSLRDFIISLDKSKADKLRYKVEDNIVRIFITPYKTSISQADLEFSEGDFNVDVVVALGVKQQEDLDEAITAHGRILHDATVTSVNTEPDGGLGAINWYDPQASSLSELVTELAQTLGGQLIDNQIATALLTGIVSETDRFSNDKTSSQTMSVSAALMAAGANQQLVASKLEEGAGILSVDRTGGAGGNASAPLDTPADDGTIQIDHNAQGPAPDGLPDMGQGQTPDGPADSAAPDTTDDSTPSEPGEKPAEAPSNLSPGAKLLTEPPSLGGTLTANTNQEGLEPTTDPFSLPSSEPPQLLDRKPDALVSPAVTSGLPPAAAEPVLPPAPPGSSPMPPPPGWAPPPDPLPPPSPTSSAVPPPSDQTLTEIEESVGNPHAAAENLDTARDEVNKALITDASTAAAPDGPIQALNAQQLGGDLHPAGSDSGLPPATPAPAPAANPLADASQPDDPNAPPPVPPPIPFQFGNPAPPPPA